MKISTYIMMGILALCSCDQNPAQPQDQLLEETSGCIRVKVVVSICADIFLEIQDENYYSLGDAEWKHADGRNTKPTFVVTNSCDMGKALYENDLLNKEFEVVQISDVDNHCVECMATYGRAFPKKAMAVRLCTGSGEQ